MWRLFWKVKMTDTYKKKLKDHTLNKIVTNTKFYIRSVVIPKIFKRLYMFSYKGPEGFLLKQSKFNIGYRLGEFSLTRKPYYYPQKERKKKR